jgi:hypothetical protein
LLVKIRALCNQAPLEVAQLQLTAGIWADELIKASIPPSKWEEMFSVARESRPSSSKAFVITADQVIDAWRHYGLRGSIWSDGQWIANRDKQIKFCGECRQGYRYETREVLRVGEFGIEESLDPPYFQEHPVGPCPCRSEQSARNSYWFRRFTAAWEIARGCEYEATSQDLLSLHSLIFASDGPSEHRWDEAIGEYLSTVETLNEFCMSAAFEDIHAERRREEGIRRRQKEQRAEEQRKAEERRREYQEKLRRQEEARREAIANRAQWLAEAKAFAEAKAIAKAAKSELEPESSARELFEKAVDMLVERKGATRNEAMDVMCEVMPEAEEWIRAEAPF